jgi:hypothetical protein
MSATQKDSVLESITALSRRLVSLAQSDGWAEAETVEAERQTLIQQYFSNCPDEQDPEQQRQALQILLDLNEKVMGMLRERRQTLISDLQSIEEGRVAARAYSNNRK